LILKNQLMPLHHIGLHICPFISQVLTFEFVLESIRLFPNWFFFEKSCFLDPWKGFLEICIWKPWRWSHLGQQHEGSLVNVNHFLFTTHVMTYMEINMQHAHLSLESHQHHGYRDFCKNKILYIYIWVLVLKIW